MGVACCLCNHPVDQPVALCAAACCSGVMGRGKICGAECCGTSADTGRPFCNGACLAAGWVLVCCAEADSVYRPREDPVDRCCAFYRDNTPNGPLEACCACLCCAWSCD